MIMRFRAYSVELSLIVILFLAIGFFGYLGYGLVASSVGSRPFSGARALEYARTQIEEGPRTTGSLANERLKEWFSQELRDNGWHVVIQPFTTNNQSSAVNLIARNRKTVDSSPVVLVGAHYNTRSVSDKDPNPENRDQPTLGANSGASGPAVLLELARRINPQNLSIRLCLAFFDASDNNDIEGWEPAEGSDYFLNTLNNFEELRSCTSPQAVIILDMVGTGSPLSFESVSDLTIANSLRQVANALSYSDLFTEGSGDGELGDQMPFARANIPTVFILDTKYTYRHTQEDTLDKLDEAALERIGRTLQTWLEETATLQ
ncbi:MAG: M28 family peptidase [Chloroflexota bacterium]